ncbi:MAG: hypothetical protein ACLR7K_15185 [Subdoligranulum sp.]
MNAQNVLREVIIGSETQVITQTETVESDKKDMETNFIASATGKGSYHRGGLFRDSAPGFGQYQN